MVFLEGLGYCVGLSLEGWFCELEGFLEVGQFGCLAGLFWGWFLGVELARDYLIWEQYF